MPKKVARKTHKKSSVRRTSSGKRTNVLFREIPQLHALTVVFYALLIILFIAIYITRFA